jgi:hypothetical protein
MTRSADFSGSLSLAPHLFTEWQIPRGIPCRFCQAGGTRRQNLMPRLDAWERDRSRGGSEKRGGIAR